MSLKKKIVIGLAILMLLILVSFSVTTLIVRLDHPDPRITEPLAAHLDGVDRIRVRTGGTCKHPMLERKPLFDETDPNTISAVIGKIALAQLGDGMCGCCGNPSFEFYKNGQLIATISLHHGIRIRWPDVWPADAELTLETKSFIRQWLAANNVDLEQLELNTPLYEPE